MAKEQQRITQLLPTGAYIGIATLSWQTSLSTSFYLSQHPRTSPAALQQE